MLPTHLIVSMQGGRTKNSASPMWRCTCADGERVNVFKHVDPDKNSAALFDAAGYLEDMLTLGDGQYMIWKSNPIGVVLGKSADGKWWEVKAVLPRPANAQPDLNFKPNLAWYKCKAQRIAQMLSDDFPVYLDVETTGLDNDAEIISIAVQSYPETYLYTLVRPFNLAAAAKTQDIHGISPDDLVAAPTWRDLVEIEDPPSIIRKLSLHDHLVERLHLQRWAGYNINFDVHMLDLALMRSELSPVITSGIHDVMQIYSWYAGLWDETFQRWQHIKLTESAAALGINTDGAHNALADVRMTYELIQRIGSEQ